MVKNMSGLSGFERSVKDSLEPYEVPYNSADWAQLERSLDQNNGNGRVSRSGLYALLLGGSLAAASSFTVLMRPDVPVPVGGEGTMVERVSVQPISGSEEESIVPPVIVASPAHADVVAPNTTTPEMGGPTPETTKQRSSAISSEAARPIATANEPSGGGAPLVRANITEGCPGTLIEFAVDNLPEEGIYLWNFGDGSFSNKPAPNHAFAKSGSFEVMLSHSSSGGGNISNKPAADRIVIHEAPEASFNVLKQEYENTVPSVHFENRSLGGRSYSWDFGDGAVSAVAHPDHVYKKSGVYHVKLAVTNAKGCVDNIEKTVRIDSDYDLLAPKSFSPNGDGTDDVFMPEALKTLGVKFHLSVFDSKSGELVYETNDAQRPWNGRVTNRGDLCVSGSYVWMVEMKDGEKLGGTYNGSLDLVR
ncbi:MAG: PKD domain-containing protein [Flavobacteriales bacterium]|nr:PKD domain-containing protein [Flavobacteriales bacterium]